MAFFRNTTFDTEPLVIHGQGDDLTKPFFAEVRDAFFATPARDLLDGTWRGGGFLPPAPRDLQTGALTILTWNSRETPGLLERSLDHLGIPYVVKGRGINDWTNSRDKPRLTVEALHEIDTPYVLAVDSFDAFVTGDPLRLIADFETHFDADLVFNGGKVNWPNVADFKRFEESLPGAEESEFRYLNGGAWIGRLEFCRRFFAEACATQPSVVHPESEQGILKQLLPRHPRVRLDYRCRMFQTLGYVFQRNFQLRSAERSC